jgi:hypothetical protein
MRGPADFRTLGRGFSSSPRGHQVRNLRQWTTAAIHLKDQYKPGLKCQEPESLERILTPVPGYWSMLQTV